MLSLLLTVALFTTWVYPNLLPHGPHWGSHHNGHEDATKMKPNFIFIITDDQDLHMNSLDYQPAIQRHFAEQGTFFSKHYCTISICCPSRVSLLTGRAAHNTNVTDVSLPYGGYPKFIAEGWNDNYLPVWLQAAGYNTYYTGKLMNGHSVDTYNDPYAAAWNGTNFLIDPGTYIYYNSTTQRDQEEPQYNPGEYSTDIVAASSLGFLDDALSADGPFFIGVAPIAPHAETVRLPDGVAFYDPVPADRHKNLFPDLKVPRTPNFNPDVPSGGGFIKTLEKQNDTVVSYNDGFYRARIQSLQAVDELIDSIMLWMEGHPAILENTYIIYTTDNGFHIGNHRLPPGKTCNLEEDINIPFFVRGPGVPKGEVATYPTSHTDIVPTLFELAGIPLQAEFDGEPIPITKEMQESARQKKSEHVNLEFWGEGIFEGIYAPDSTAPLAPSTSIPGVGGPNNTWKSVRVVSDDFDLAYTVWCTNEHELYDMKTDPYQMNNLLASNKTDQWIFGFEQERFVARVDALLLTLKACKGRVCTRPWETLHPKGDVNSLLEAMNEKFDGFYMEEQRKVTFSACALGYLPWLEGELEPLEFRDARGRLARRGRWEDMV